MYVCESVNMCVGGGKKNIQRRRDVCVYLISATRTKMNELRGKFKWLQIQEETKNERKKLKYWITDKMTN